MKKASWPRRIGRQLIRLAVLYGVLLVVILWFENRLVFPASTAAQCWYPPPADCRGEDVWLATPDHTPVHAWWSKPADWKPEDGALLYCHGNGGNLSFVCGMASYWVNHRRTAILFFDYPGYGKSGGRPSETGCYSAADVAYDWLLNEQHVPEYRLLLYGGSLGGGVATELATHRSPRALVLVSTFTSIPAMAQKQYPFFPARLLVTNQFNNLAKIGKVHRPAFIIHGTADGLIPISMGKALFDAANEPKEFFTVEGGGHDDCGAPPAFDALEKFLAKHAP